MNKTYRLIWSAVRCAFVVTHERAASHGKPSSTRKAIGLPGLLLSLASSLAIAAPPGATLPTGGQIVGGAAAGNIAANGNTMTVTQLQARMVANWSSFSIGSDASVNFVQPSAAAVALNRVIGQSPSEIFGRLTSNGQVMLVNPAGIVFGQSGQVNTAGLVASTLAISDANFMAGKYSFVNDGTAGSINNQGRIVTADGGVVAFIAPVIANDGHIESPKGMTLLAAANSLDIDFTGDGLVSYRINSGIANALVSNSGSVSADGGVAVFTAKSADAVAQAVVNNTGVVQARKLQSINGKVVLEGDLISNAGTVEAGSSIQLSAQGALVNTGTLSAGDGATGGTITANVRNLIEAGTWDVGGSLASGSIQVNATRDIEQTAASRMAADGGTGGSVRLIAAESLYLSGSVSANGTTGTGGDIAVTAPETILAGTQVSAHGATGGGRVRIGGGWQGMDSDLANATTTTITASSTLTANATNNGNGGTVVVWSDQNTGFAGTIEAKGGVNGGNGGQVEVSSHDHLTFVGLVATAAPLGQNGSLLLDPKNITIDAAAGSGSAFSVIPLTYANPGTGDSYGSGSTTELSTGNIVIANTKDDRVATNAGAVRLYKPDGTLLSTLTGSLANDQVGYQVSALTGNGNFVVDSVRWNNGGVIANAYGAVTWGSGITGVSGVVSSANSLVGTSVGDQVGTSVSKLTNGNFLVSSNNWHSGGTNANAFGAVTWGNGSSGVLADGSGSGVVSATNSLVGSTVGDRVGLQGMVVLTNSNYVVRSINWGAGSSSTTTGLGAVTWGSGTTGVVGTVSAVNSLVGSTAGDLIGSYNGAAFANVLALNNGNYIVSSPNWSNAGVAKAGAITWGDGTTGTVGTISTANSLVGSHLNDQIGIVTTSVSTNTLTGNSNVLVASGFWDNGSASDAGAVTWINGSNGHLADGSSGGAISATNSLVGTNNSDSVGTPGFIRLTNGNYVVLSQYWNGNRGAATWGNGSTGTVGVVSAMNSLVGSTVGDLVGGNVGAALTNGNYVIISSNWANGAATSAGAVTWGDGANGTSGAVSAANSLVGTTTGDKLGSVGAGITATPITTLSNGNYIVTSTMWHNGGLADAGAVTWGNGLGGTVGAITSSNSLIGSHASDQLGSPGTSGLGVVKLTNGNVVISSLYWDNGAATDAGAVTWMNGSNGLLADGSSGGVVSAVNSLVGSTTGDQVGYKFGSRVPIVALSSGNYYVISPYWHNGGVTEVNAGAVTWGNGSIGTVGAVSSTNSLTGQKNDGVGQGGVTVLTNGNYVVSSPSWGNGTSSSYGAATWVNGTNGQLVGGTFSGYVSATNSLVGTTVNDTVATNGVVALTNDNYLVRSGSWHNGAASSAGAVTWGSGSTGIAGAVSAANSLVGSTTSDQIGSGGVTTLANGNYVVQSPSWSNGAATMAGAATLGDGSTGVSGVVSATNSLVGSTVNDQVGQTVTALSNSGYVVTSSNWNNGAATTAGAVTLAGNTGITGVVSASNSFVGTSTGDQIGSNGVVGLTGAMAGSAVVNSASYSGGTGRVDILKPGVAAAGFSLPQDYATNSSADSTFTPAQLTALLNVGTDVTLKANNDITVNSAIIASNPGGDGGMLSLYAGRSILINANITTGNGAVWLLANDKSSNDNVYHLTPGGVVDAYRSPGNAVITMANGVTIDTGTKEFTASIFDGAGNTNHASGNITLANVSALNIWVQNLGTTAGSGVVLNGHLISGAGGINIAAGKGFTNNAGSSALQAGGGSNWYVFADSPNVVSKGGLTSDFRAYNSPYDPDEGSYIGSSTGNGFVYASAPAALTVNTALASGSASHTFGATPTAAFSTSITGFADNEDNAGNIGLTGNATLNNQPSSSTAVGNSTVSYASGFVSNVGYTFVVGTGVAYSVAATATGTGSATSASDTPPYVPPPAPPAPPPSLTPPPVIDPTGPNSSATSNPGPAVPPTGNSTNSTSTPPDTGVPPSSQSSGAVTIGFGGQRGTISVSGDTVTLNLPNTDTADSSGMSGSAGNLATHDSAVLLFNMNGGGLQPAGALTVSQQGQSLKASSSASEVSSIPTISPDNMRFVTADFQEGNGSTSKITVGISPEGVLLVKVPASLKTRLDDRGIVLIGIGIARDQLNVSPTNIKGVVIQSE